MELKRLLNKNLKPNEIDAVKELKKAIQTKFSDSKLILFGSKARGDYDRESDIDILILLKEYSFEKEKAIWNISFYIELKYNIIFSILVESKRWFKIWDNVMPIIETINNEGIPI